MYRQLNAATHCSQTGQICEAQQAGAHLAASYLNRSAGHESHGYSSQLQQGATTVQTGYPSAPKGGLPTGLPSLQTNFSHEALQVGLCADRIVPSGAFMLKHHQCRLRTLPGDIRTDIAMVLSHTGLQYQNNRTEVALRPACCKLDMKLIAHVQGMVFEEVRTLPDSPSTRSPRVSSQPWETQPDMCRVDIACYICNASSLEHSLTKRDTKGYR